MPEATATITRGQRNALYELVRNHLGALNDVWIAMEHDRDFAKAERLGSEFSDDFRLLADIGWAEQDPRTEIELSMPAGDLARLVSRLRSEAEQGLAEPDEQRAAREEDEAAWLLFWLARNACDELIAELDRERNQGV